MFESPYKHYLVSNGSFYVCCCYDFVDMFAILVVVFEIQKLFIYPEGCFVHSLVNSRRFLYRCIDHVLNISYYESEYR